ncbi:MAG: RES family NAD+ phosphorylase [Cycloclasticus sp.]|jgi:RES domain.
MICVECVNIESIKSFVNKIGAKAQCKYCEKENISADIEAVFTKIEEQASDVLRPVEELSSMERGLIFECGSSEPPVFAAFEFFEEFLCEDAANELMDWLPDNYNQTSEGHDALFALDDGTLEENEITYEWDRFIEGVNHGYRYFNQGSSRFLDKIFETISTDGKLRPEVVKSFGNGDKFYRARLANTHKDIKSIEAQPHKELGPVPKEFAGSQRMTPAGISAMYCALDRSTCLSELRPIVGDTVISAEFKPTSKLKFLDLSKLEKLNTGNMDELSVGFRQHANVCEFLKDMVFNLSKPLARQDELGYLSTQVFFEYLRVKYHHEVDGVFFPSVQCDGQDHNIALFPESSSVLSVDGKVKVFVTPDTDFPNDRVPKFQVVDKSLIFHKIKSVSVESDDEPDSFKLVTDEDTLKKIYGRRT